MMDRAWLALTEETAIEPELEIVDAHHHLWDVETRYGRYDLDDLLTDTEAGHRVVQTVFIDCGSNYRPDGPRHLRPLGETEYVAAEAEASEQRAAAGGGGAVIAAIVGHADLTLGADVGEVLTAHVELAGGRYRGIRHTGARAEDPTVPASRTEPPAGLYGTESFREGARTLAAMGLSFEAWQYHHQLGEVAELARAVPELTVVINHLGGPLGVGRAADRRSEVFEVLRTGLTEVATCPNAVLKLGGIGMSRLGAPWAGRDRPPTSDEVVAEWGELLRWSIDTFGPARCLFESNYPVDGETIGYVVLWNAFKKVSSGYDRAERADLFAGTARRVYRLEAPDR